MKRSIAIVAGAAVSCVLFTGSAFAAPATSLSAAKPKPRTVTVNVASVFATPGETVQCQMFRAKGASNVTSIACHVWNSQVSSPPTPKTCRGKAMVWGDIELTSNGKAHYGCFHTPGMIGVAQAGAPGRAKQQAWWNKKTDVLTKKDFLLAPAAGSTFRGGAITCTVREKSLKCTNTKTKHWFDISPTKITLR